VAQETAHSWGLDHKFDNRDPMTYLNTGPAHKDYQNEAGSCGEYSARSCMCTYSDTGKSKMNSFARVLTTFGSSVPDTMPPTVRITSPTNGAQVPGTLQVTAMAMDNNVVSKVELRLDGNLVGTATQSPYVWSTATALSQGAHTLKATAYDLMNNTADAQISVQNGASCKKASDCPDGDTCVDGRCVQAGDHGLGATCTSNTDCASNQCGQDADGNRYCVESCDPSKHGCPGGFGCLATGATGGVCWPGADSGGGGCNTDGNGTGGAVFFGIGLVGAAIAFRRRR
jgi:hypothetical protein